MKTMIRTLMVVVLPFLSVATWAEVTQDCILEGKVDKRKATQAGRDIYVAFHSAKEASQNANCNINDRRNRIEFKQPKTSGIEDAPHGAKVKYRYTEKNNQESEWQLLDISKF